MPGTRQPIGDRPAASAAGGWHTRLARGLALASLTCGGWLVSACAATPYVAVEPVAAPAASDPPLRDRSGDPLASAAAPAAPNTAAASLLAAPKDAEAGAAPAGSPTSGAVSAAEIAGTGGDESAEIEDDVEDAPAASPPAAPQPRPFAELSDAEIERRVKSDVASLGPMSLGYANQGAQLNAVQMPAGQAWEIIDGTHAWATQETVDALAHCIEVVADRFPGTPKMKIGHLSTKRGGRLSPHKSHQSGRDVDVGYYYSNGDARWYVTASAGNLDVARTWTFVRALLTDADPEFIFINTSVQKPLKEYALQIGEDPTWLDHVFQYQSHDPWPIIRHAPGHDTHIHVRFYNPRAQEMGRRAYDYLVKYGKYTPQAPKKDKTTTETVYAVHIARKGDTLHSLARRYGTTVEAIQAANGMKTIHIKAKQPLKIPTKQVKVVTTAVTQKVKPPPRVIVVPPRRLPPRDPTGMASPKATASHAN